MTPEEAHQLRTGRHSAYVQAIVEQLLDILPASGEALVLGPEGWEKRRLVELPVQRYTTKSYWLVPLDQHAPPVQHDFTVRANTHMPRAATGWCWECTCGAESYGHETRGAAKRDAENHLPRPLAPEEMNP